MIELDAGDAVLFRYDVRHGGAAYTSQHIRLHEYWEPIIGAGDIEFRVGVHFGREGGNQLHAMETGASWNKKSAASNPGKRRCIVEPHLHTMMLQRRTRLSLDCEF